MKLDLKYNRNNIQNSENIFFIIIREYLKKEFLIPEIDVKLKNYDEKFYINYLFNGEIDNELKGIENNPIWKDKIYKIFDDIYKFF